MSATLGSYHVTEPPSDEERRDFLLLATATVGAVGTGLAVWPFIDSMNPARDTLAIATSDLDLQPIAAGQRITVVWQGKPVFVDHRTPEQIAAARAADQANLPDPEPDAARVQNEEWLVVVGICTHLGCIPLGQKDSDPRGEYGGWFCPCHGSHYDTSGRIRKGPAPLNLVVPPYTFDENTALRIG
jgi:ubiquinol-cytochrome c reductase iron-sulfur subunit